MSADDNAPFFDWPDPEEPAREVWYTVVSHPDEPVAFWHRYTLVSTDDGDEARVWGALTDAREDGAHVFRTEQYDLEAIDLEPAPFALGIGEGNLLRSDAAVGSLEGLEWSFEHTPDDLTFSPIRDEELMLQAAESMGTGVHWSANQSVAMHGEVTVDGTTIAFDGAPGHQGHTAGPNAPTDWAWVHCNDFDGAATASSGGGDASGEPAVALEALSLEGRVPVCLRLPGETHLLNRQAQVFGDVVETETNEPGRWTFSGATEDVSFDVDVTVDGDWHQVSYLTPDGSLRYNAHSTLATVELTVRTDDVERTYRSDAARAEWVSDERPLPGEYPPFAADE